MPILVVKSPLPVSEMTAHFYAKPLQGINFLNFRKKIMGETKDNDTKSN